MTGVDHKVLTHSFDQNDIGTDWCQSCGAHKDAPVHKTRIVDAANHIREIGWDSIGSVIEDPTLMLLECKAVVEWHQGLRQAGRIGTMMYGIAIGIQMERERQA